MKKISTTHKIFQNKRNHLHSDILVIGFNEDLISTLPQGSYIIDSSLLKIKGVNNTHHTFETKNLQTFNLHRKFSNILSLNSLHLEKELEKIICCIYNHLTEEAVLYFPLAPNALIHDYLVGNNLISKEFSPTFQYRTRENIENAVLKLPFSSILIEERIETLNFSSKEELYLYLLEKLPEISNLKGKILENTAQSLTKELYKEPDKILTLLSPWILLTLSRENNF